MAVKIYDASAGAFKDAPTPQIYDASAQAYKDSTGLVYDTSKGAWEERWGNLANGVLYDSGKENKKYFNSLDLSGAANSDIGSHTIVTYKKELNALWMNFTLTNGYRNNATINIGFDGNCLQETLVNKLLDEGFTNINMYGKIAITTKNENQAYFRIHNSVTYKDFATPSQEATDQYYTATLNMERNKKITLQFLCGNYYDINATAEIYKIWASK